MSIQRKAMRRIAPYGTPQKWLVGFYIRLSKEDKDKKGDNSNSVENQDMILHEFVEEHEEREDMIHVDTYIEACDIIEPTQKTA